MFLLPACLNTRFNELSERLQLLFSFFLSFFLFYCQDADSDAPFTVNFRSNPLMLKTIY